MASPDHQQRPDHRHWFEPIAEHLGSAYLRYSFTKGTRQEIDFLMDALRLRPGMRVLDVGCGPGRHAHELARRGLYVHGVDISERFVDLAREHAPGGATFERLDARDFAKHFGITLLLKGQRSVIAAANGECWINPTGTPAVEPRGRDDGFDEP